jgi:hypothetical protein
MRDLDIGAGFPSFIIHPYGRINKCFPKRESQNKEDCMRNIIRLFGIIALVAIIGFGFAACESLGSILPSSLSGGGSTAAGEQVQTSQAALALPAELIGTWPRDSADNGRPMILMADGTGKDLQNYTTFVWSVEGNKFKWDNSEYTWTLEGDTLTLSTSQSNYLYVRGTADQTARYEKQFVDGVELADYMRAWNPGPNQPSPVGVWEEIAYDGETVGDQYTFNANGTGQEYSRAFNRTTNFTWRASGNTLTNHFTAEGGYDMEYIYSIEGNRLTRVQIQNSRSSDFANKSSLPNRQLLNVGISFMRRK